MLKYPYMGSVRYMGINNLEINLKFMNVFTVFSFFFGINFILEIAFERISTMVFSKLSL